MNSSMEARQSARIFHHIFTRTQPPRQPWKCVDRWISFLPTCNASPPAIQCKVLACQGPPAAVLRMERDRPRVFVLLVKTVTKPHGHHGDLAAACARAETAMAESQAQLVKDLVDAGVHFGHRVSRWNPKMEPYIHGKRNMIHII